MKRAPILLAAGAALLLITGWLVTVRIEDGSVGVIAPSVPDTPARVLPGGFHFVPPGTIVRHYSLATATSAGEILVTPSTGGEVPLRFMVTGRIDPAKVGALHEALATGPIENFLSAVASEFLRQAAARTEAVEILTPGFRDRTAGAISTAMQKAGVMEARFTLKPPDDLTLLAAAQYLMPRREAWKIRMTVSEALLDPDRAKSWRLLTAMGLVNESELLLREAETSYLDALAADPVALPPMSQLVNLYTAVGELEKLQRVLDAALQADPKSLQHLNWGAMVVMKQGNLEIAEKLLREAALLDPGSAIIQSNLSGILLKTGRIPEAIALLRELVASTPSNTQAIFNLGSALAAENQFTESLAWLSKVEAAGPVTPALAETLATVNEKLGNRAKAAAWRETLRKMEAEAARDRRTTAPRK